MSSPRHWFRHGRRCPGSPGPPRASRCTRRISLIRLWSGCWLPVKHPEGSILPAGPLEPPGGGDAEALTPRRSLTLDRIVGREIQLSRQIQQEEHQMVRRQPLHWRRRQQQCVLRFPWALGCGLAHAQFSCPDTLVSQGSGQIWGRLWRSQWPTLFAAGS